MSKRCSSCGTELPDEARFCAVCGKDSFVQEESAKKEPAVCSKCGAMLKPEAKFCADCGSPVENPQAESGGYEGGTEQNQQQTQDGPEPIHFQAPPQSESNKNEGKPTVWYILAAAAVIVVVTMVLFMIGGEDHISEVTDASMEQYSDRAVGDVFEYRFGDCEWSEEERDGKDYVIFEGYDKDTLDDWVVEFKLRGEHFTVSNIEVNGTWTDDSDDINSLLWYVYTGDTDYLYDYDLEDIWS